MGIDVGIDLFDFSKFTKDEVTHHLDHIKKDLEDEETTEHGELVRKIDSASEYAEKVYNFDEEGRNILNLYDLHLFLNANPLTLNKQFNSFSLGKSSTVMEVRIPEFLAQHSEETADLWKKLVGRGKNMSSTNKFELQIAESNYLVDRCEQGGYLQGGEIKLLREGLKTLMPKSDEFYESLEEDKDRYFAKKTRPIELIYGLVGNEYNIFESSILIYYRDT